VTVDDLAAPGETCICCRNNGVLPTASGIPGVVDKDTILGCCEECIAALFFGGTHPHPSNPLLFATVVTL
jgi:hypothetical protein